ncbi:unnamed protein product [Clonostachys rosea f. rosea IK726]|jgi:hypothetical protein|uniref:Uncharacterized protein n=1 Tax=Clonostachys rosea f. rosea IK726 TaxID=1349383 RepID=A0ACA9TZ08_BIOOC|nr:unnamed protein product [Clonostachys rosea f. rosea IK726]
MSKQPTGIPEWAGAPPASEGGFAFAHGEFFAEATGQNRHRRATIPELKEQIASGTDKDRPAHWFEAQLLHYGLKPSKTKSVARMRLLDAVNGTDLAVPDHISKLEKKLKTAWTKSEREAKKTAITPAAASKAPPSSAKTTGGAKRKAEPEKSTPRKKPSTSQPAANKAKPAPAKPDEPTPNKPRAKQTARRGGTAASGPSRGSPITTASPASAMPRQTARRGGVATSGPSRSASTASTSQASAMPRQTARRGGSHATARNPPSQPKGFPSGSVELSSDDDDPPPPYTMVEDNELAPLGLLNGDYHIRSSDVTEQWSHLGSEFDLTLTISGRQLWGRFDLGVIEGIMHFSERPWASSDEGVSFTWRGRENEGPIFYGGRNRGEIRFLGGGVIEGRFDYQGIEFHGRRVPDQGTRSSVSASNMEREWDDYNEDRYEEENRSRWW